MSLAKKSSPQPQVNTVATIAQRIVKNAVQGQQARLGCQLGDSPTLSAVRDFLSSWRSPGASARPGREAPIWRSRPGQGKSQSSGEQLISWDARDCAWMSRERHDILCRPTQTWSYLHPSAPGHRTSQKGRPGLRVPTPADTLRQHLRGAAPLRARGTETAAWH